MCKLGLAGLISLSGLGGMHETDLWRARKVASGPGRFTVPYRQLAAGFQTRVP